MGIKNQEISQVRKKIEKTIELAEEERKRKLQIQRLEFARAGIGSIKRRKIGEAVKSFHSYLRTLEELKGVAEGKLTPSCFDLKKDQHELLMISAIYWDLVKMYDRTRSAQKKGEFLHYMGKYVLFSKGMPFQALCAESLRKYVSSDKAIHRSDFVNAHRALSVSKCFVASSLADVSSPLTLPRLRIMRDQFLRHHALGRQFIVWYYRHGPQIAEWTNSLPRVLRKTLAMALDLFAWTFFLMQNGSNSFRSKEKLPIAKIKPKR